MFFIQFFRLVQNCTYVEFFNLASLSSILNIQRQNSLSNSKQSGKQLKLAIKELIDFQCRVRTPIFSFHSAFCF